MATKKLFFLFSILLSMIGTKAWAYDIEVKNDDGVTIYYNYINDGKELEVTFGYDPNDNFYNGLRYSGNIIIPEEVTYMNRVRKVTSIGSCAFMNCYNLIFVLIPRSISNIGRSAFESCAISSFVIPDETIEIGDDAFRYCNNLTSISIGKGLSYISKEAFYSSGLTSVVIPDNVKVLKSSAFEGCENLLSITIGSGLEIIEGYAFGYCNNLRKVIIKDIKKWCNITLDSYYNSTQREYQYYYTNPLSVCKHLFSDEDTEITELVIPEGVDIINNFTFYGCENITSVSFPSSLTVIGERAFYECGIISLVIGDNVEDIQLRAFCGCPLNTITIPNNVKCIGDGAFGGNISSVYSYIKEPFSISSNTFTQNTFYNATLYVPKGTIDKYKATEGWSKFAFIEEDENDNTPTYKLTYMVDGEVYKTYELSGGDAITPEAAPTKEGYEFSGWSTIPETMPAEDVTITGSFQLITDEDVINLKETGKGTWCSESDLDFTGLEDIKAYIASGYDDIKKTIWLTRVYSVPAGTGIMVKGTPGDHKIPHATVRAYYANMFKGVVGSAVKVESTDGDWTNYYMAGGQFKMISGSTTINPNRCYLQLPTLVFAGTRSVDVVYEDELDVKTGINPSSITNDQEPAIIYNLQGQRVENPKKGLYIKNGKKVIIR